MIEPGRLAVRPGRIGEGLRPAADQHAPGPPRRQHVIDHQGDVRVALRVAEFPGPREIPAADVDRVELGVVAPAERHDVRHPGCVDCRAGRACLFPGRSVRRQRIRSCRTHPPVTIVKADGREVIPADSDHRLCDRDQAVSQVRGRPYGPGVRSGRFRGGGRFRGNQRKRKLVKHHRRSFALFAARALAWVVLAAAGAGARAAGWCAGGGLAAGMVNFRAEAMVSRGAGSGARHPGLLALRSASGLGMPADAGRPAPTAFNRAGEKLRAAGEELPRVSGGVGPRRLGGLALPLLREEGHWAPVAGAGGMEALVRPPALGGGGCAGRRRRRRSRRPSWCRGRPGSRSSAARMQHTPPGPWRGAHGPRPRSR